MAALHANLCCFSQTLEATLSRPATQKTFQITIIVMAIDREWLGSYPPEEVNAAVQRSICPRTGTLGSLDSCHLGGRTIADPEFEI